jgi:hypothetical protein
MVAIALGKDQKNLEFSSQLLPLAHAMNMGKSPHHVSLSLFVFNMSMLHLMTSKNPFRYNPHHIRNLHFHVTTFVGFLKARFANHGFWLFIMPVPSEVKRNIHTPLP